MGANFYVLLRAHEYLYLSKAIASRPLSSLRFSLLFCKMRKVCQTPTVAFLPQGPLPLHLALGGVCLS